MEELRRYELYVIFQPELEDEQLETQIDRLNGSLTGGGGAIIEVARRGKRRLAYPINRFNQGIDVVYQTSLPTSRVEALERQLNLNEDVLRYLVVRRDDLEESEQLVASQEEVQAEVAELQAESPEPVLTAATVLEEVEETPPLLPEPEGVEEVETAVQAGTALETDAVALLPETTTEGTAVEESNVDEGEEA